MGAKPEAAVRLCVNCGQLKAAVLFPPGRRKCVACQAAPTRRRERSGVRHSREELARARARDQALRRLGLEHLDAYRELYRAERREIPTTVPAARARKLAVSRALRALEQRHRPRYEVLYRQELEQARAQPLPRRPGRPPGTPDRLTIPQESAGLGWRQDAGGAGAGQPRPQGNGARQRAERQAVREQAAVLFAQGVPTSSVADQLGVARQTAVSWRARWRTGGAAALRSRGPSRRPSVPDSELPMIEQALRRGAAAHGFDSDVWSIARVGTLIQRLTGVKLERTAVRRLLHERLGWSAQALDKEPS